MKKTNKNYQRLSIFFLMILGMFIVSCKNPLNLKHNSKDAKKAYIRISTNLSDSKVRSALPESFYDSEKEDTKSGLIWELSGEESNGSEYEKIWEDDSTTNNTAYKQMLGDTSIELDVGTWTFTLTAYVKNSDDIQEKVLESTIQKTIVSGQNSLSFEMEEAVGDEGVANGEISFTLSFPKGVVTNLVINLYNYPAFDGEFNPVYENPTECKIDNEVSSYEYSTIVESGNYLLAIELQQQTGINPDGKIPIYTTINTYTCLIHVAPGLCSEGEYTLDTLAQLYTIEYKYIDGEATVDAQFNDTVTTSYNKYQTFTLPIPIRDGYEFVGWYTSQECSGEPITEYNIPDDFAAEEIVFYAKWEEIETVFAEKFVLEKQDEFKKLVALEDDESSSLVEGKYTEIQINKTSVINAWTYFVYPENNQKFKEEGNYKVSVELWAETDTVVAISAARSDMYFTVEGNTTDEKKWTKCEFETGLIKDFETAEISFGVGMSSKTRIRNLTVTKVENENLPSLAFNISKQGIENYLNKGDSRPEKILEVTKTDDSTGYDIKINTPLSHVDESSNSVVQDVTLELRGYAETKGINEVSFELELQDGKTVYTSLCADTNSPKSISWNNAKTQIESTSATLKTVFPVYNNSEELSVSLIKESDTVIDNTSFSIKNFNVAGGSQSFSDKDFVIKIHNNHDNSDTYYKAQNDSLPFEQEITLAANESREFDVLMFNDFEENSPIDWNDVTRFIYSDIETYIGDGEQIRYYINGEGKYYIENKSESQITCKITLKDDFTVLIEEVTGTNNDQGAGGEDGSVESGTESNVSEKNSGLQYVSKNDIESIMIHSAEGLKIFSQMINGTFENDIVFTYESGYPAKTFSKNTVHYLNGYLQDDIEVSDWIPIGTADHPFTSSFDGQGHSITIKSMSSDDGEYAGVFGYVGNQSASTTSISNLVVKGQDAGITTSAQYAGGIVAYSYGATISNCVNKLKIDASASSTGYLGGIVGYTKKDTIISSCVNFAELVSTSSIGGIVGFADVENNYSPLSIDKCINIGSIKGSKTNNFVSGILGRTATATTISNCINFGERGCNGGTVPLNHSGVATVTDSGNLSISNCINAGPYANISNSGSIAIADGDIIESSYLYYNKDNWYYDDFGSQKQGNVEDTCTVSGLSTEDFFDSSKCVLIDNGNWSCVSDKSRYPLPDLSSVFTGNTIWQEICEVAKVEVSSGGGEDEIAVVSSFENLKSTIESITDTYTKDNPYVIGIENDITIESKITITNHIKLVSLGEECKLVRSDTLQEDNLFLVSADASLTLGDSDSTGSLVIDGGAESTSTTLKKSLINVSTSGTLVLNENSILQNNNCTASYDATNGGAIYSSGGTININGGTIRNNSTSYKSHYGGAIYLENGTFTMTAGSFENNSTYKNGGALYLNSCETNITGGNFTGNSTTTGTTSCYGGAIYILTSSSDSEAAVISNCTFESNTAYQSGGAIYTGKSGKVEIKNCNFKNNTVSNSTAKGGAIYVENTDGSVSVNDCMFDGNTSPAIAKTQSSIVVTVDGEEINTSDGWDPSSTSGGGVVTSWSDLISSVDNASEGDVIFVSGQFDVTEPITISKNITIKTESGANFVLNNSNFTNNSIYGIFNISNGKLTLIGASNDYRIIIDGSSQDGYTSNILRLINVTSNGSLETNYVTLQNLNGEDTTSSGIFFNNSTGTLSVINTKINNIKGKQGAGICVNKAKDILIEDSIIENCVATSEGGAIYLYGQSECIIKGTTLSQNSVQTEAGFGGGAISISSNSAKVYLNNNCNIVNNYTNKNGGGILIDSGSLFINSATIKDNSCDGQGKNIFSTTDNAGNKGNIYIHEELTETTVFDDEILIS